MAIIPSEDVDSRMETSGSDDCEAQQSANGVLKKALNTIQVSKPGVLRMEKALEKEIFEKWHEACEVMKTSSIPQSSIEPFLSHLERSYEGITPDITQKLKEILISQEWEYQLMEWKYNHGDDSSMRYGLLAFGRSPDKKFIDCIHAVYKIDFKIASKVDLTKEDHTTTLGLIEFTPQTKFMESASENCFNNFFRLKALEGFYNEGLIESINYAPNNTDVE
ncbi:uncharacterized protein LOC134262651 [Saccostrea cucullata]|uniref:uncharacterized protein LOC134262651 n=1 Tax=Saccostrea cuccullata TaxID=36930 RepID=UPI002ED1A4B6